MRSFRIIPSLGIKNDVEQDDPTMFRWLGEGFAHAHCVDGRNFDVSRRRGASSKAVGRGLFSNSAAATTQTCLGIFELYDGTNRVLWTAMGDGSSKGRLFRYDASRDPVRISDVVGHAGAVEFAYNATDFYSFIKYGTYMIFADRAEHTPYCGDFNDTAVAKLISSGTEYKFRYLENWQNRIFGAYSDQTNGDIDIRWSNLLPTPQSSCTFAAANQLYVPNDDPITGIRRMGRNNCFVYCENSINRLIHYPESNQPFSIMTVVDNVGAVTHHSIVDIGGIHFFFNEDYGFMQFDGNVWKPIGESVRDTFETIKLSSMPYIIGAHSQTTSEVVWTVPVDSSATPNCLLYYNYRTGDWRRKDLAMRYVAHSRKVTDITTMTSLINLGYTKGSDFGNQTMQALLSEDKSIAYSNTDGKMYYDGTEADAGAAWDGYRLEPVMDFGDPLRQDTLREIWFNLSVTGDFQIYILHRSGDTVGETITSRWNILDTVSCNDPVNPVCYCNQTNRFHQILWGSSSNGQPFVVREIDFRYEPQRVY